MRYYDDTLKKPFIIYGNLEVICTLRRLKGVWVVYVYVHVIQAIFTYLGNHLLANVWSGSELTEWGEGFEVWTF